ncbi:MAG TPA: TetR/AcrR family transcriptional regulator [Caldisericia bacterium]|nr:TetR/AcrR family transcriptional regulator [Caldisericia bacterium]HPB34409.1 TetR/AcrR family transcriptional regulator [Caldisericia bacterium]HQL66542.1 TetR/AcrR family transcriptional regulator [Caldisericia bacterium]HQN48600.1 TetR/AcrR family transcriptional regulator [Caldisericia bacterium]HQO99262.1 TetR/AcrR family transcriptional regulator [Caldisericia bacterium]
MNEKKIKGEETKKKIIEGAEILFTENGYDSTTVQNICNKAEISKGAFFYHFPTKEFLFLEILDKYLSELDKRMNEIEKKSKNTLRAMEEMVIILEEIFITSEGKFTIFLEFLRKASKETEIMKKISYQFQKYKKYVYEMIEKGKREENIKKEIDSEFISQLIISLAIGMILKSSLFLDKENEDFSKKGIKFILNNIKKEEEL